MKEITRKRFLSQSGKGIAGAALGGVVLSGVTPSRVLGANDRVVLGLIGAGGRGKVDAKGLAEQENVEFKYVCDVNDLRGHDFIKDMKEKQGYAPKRVIEMRDIFDDKDVDGVLIATPEHWHALASIWACQAGKDVYVEKCPTLTIHEGRKMVEAVRKYKRILQIGTQNRSGAYGYSAREYIQSGKLGKVVMVKCYNTLNGGPWSPKPDQPAPKTLDWDRWLGPAPYVPFNPGRCSSGARGRGWQQYWNYCGGQLADDGSHVLDLARLAIGDPGQPKSVFCAGGRIAYKDERETPDVQSIIYDYGDFAMTMDCTECIPYNKKSNNEVRYGDKFPYWPQNSTRIEIYGTKRMMYLGRHGGGWQVYEEDGKVVDFDYGYKPDKVHEKNFIDCIRSRKDPNGVVEQGHLSACVVHLANISLRVGNKQLYFDAEKERFTNNEEANKLLKLAYREKFRIPERV